MCIFVSKGSIGEPGSSFPFSFMPFLMNISQIISIITDYGHCMYVLSNIPRLSTFDVVLSVDVDGVARGPVNLFSEASRRARGGGTLRRIRSALFALLQQPSIRDFNFTLYAKEGRSGRGRGRGRGRLQRAKERSEGRETDK